MPRQKKAVDLVLENLDDNLHRAIKESLPFCSNSDAAKYGSFYLKYWKTADEDIKKEVEKYLQDLVHFAVFGKAILAQKIRKMLQPFVDQKRLKAVDSLLFHLLAPIIWIGLSAANCEVRLNAVELFVFVFPMNNALGNAHDNYELLQRQMEMMPTLITDPVPSIRSSAVINVCQICDLYWDIIPADILQKLFLNFVNRLAFDASSANVRIAVVKGMTAILNNPSSYNVLEKLLPRLRMCLHDNNEKVRTAFVELLLKVKELKLKTLKYWSIVSMDNILARLGDESHPRLQKSLTYLLQNSFCPENAAPEDRLQRVIMLIDKHMMAARKFFVYIPEALPSFDIAIEYILLMLRCVYSCVRQKKGEFEENDDSNQMSSSSSISKSDENSTENAACAENLTSDNVSVMCGLLECGAILWNAIGHQLVQPENTDHHKRLVKISSKIVQECFIFFDDTRITDVLLYYASLLPASSAPYLATSAVKKLQNIEDVAEIDSTVFGSLLEAVCFWRFKDIADSIVIWLDFCGDLERTASTTPLPKRPRKVKFSSTRDTPKSDPKPRLALAYLEFILTNTQCRHYLIASANRSQLVRLTDKLDRFVIRCWESCRYEDRFNDKIGLKEILLADRLTFSLQMLLTNKKEIDETVSFFVKKITYHEINTLELLSESNVNAKLNAEKVLLQFFAHCQHLLMLNLATDLFVEAFCLFLQKIVDDFGTKNIRLFCGISPAIYNIIDYLHNCESSTIKFEPFIRNLVDVWLTKFKSVFVTDKINDLLIYHQACLMSGFEAAKETLNLLLEKDDENNDETKSFLENHLQQLMDHCSGHINE